MRFPGHGRGPSDRRESVFHAVSGGHSEGETPGPIPNPEVKPFSADGTARGTSREIRTPPEYHYKKADPHGSAFLVSRPWSGEWPRPPSSGHPAADQPDRGGDRGHGPDDRELGGRPPHPAGGKGKPRAAGLSGNKPNAAIPAPRSVTAMNGNGRCYGWRCGQDDRNQYRC